MNLTFKGFFHKIENPDHKIKREMLRVAIVDPEKCKPNKCDLQCKTKCPVVRMGKLCIVVSKKDKVATISEELCNGCNICTKKCPFGAIKIINLPNGLKEETIHRYGPNSFKLHRLPTPRLGQVLGIVGPNGIGKSTALKILGGKLTPNLGDFNSPPDFPTLLAYFRGSELQNYFIKLSQGKIKALIKPQYVDTIPKMLSKNSNKIFGIRDLLDSKNSRKNLDFVLETLDLEHLYNENRDVNVLSGGELQRFAIALVCVQQADVYIFDEPSSYLDVKQRINAASCIRSILTDQNYVICVEHDLSLLDYLSDFICCLYGTSGAYGVVTMPFNVRDGINILLDGFVPTENVRFRQDSISFKMLTQVEEVQVSKKKYDIQYPAIDKTLGNFTLHVEPGSFSNSQITVLLAQNGCGKTTFLNLFCRFPTIKTSYKPQIIPIYEGTVRNLLSKYLGDQQFYNEVYKPLNIEELMDLEVAKLSGGELQRVAILLCLGKPADLYLIDEPSAYLDCEQRITIAKIIKRFIMHSRKSAFVVEHDFIMATYLADRVIYYDGKPSIECIAHSPESLLSGMNKFLKQINVTFRRDSTNYRPRINKLDSVKDTEQKLSGNYFFLDSD